MAIKARFRQVGKFSSETSIRIRSEQSQMWPRVGH